jgi:hypothetical protein
MTMALKFFYNGIKETDRLDPQFGVLQTCWYSTSRLTNYPEGTITIYAREYCYGKFPNRWVGFSWGVKNAFKVENGTDIQSDYHETDRIRVTPDHPLYAEVKAALEKNEDRREKRYNQLLNELENW